MSTLQAPADTLMSWYGQTQSRRVELVDLVGQELFVVEADSLLLHCFSDLLIDFEDGFQLLHATHSVENFLSNLVRRKCNFDIAVFDDHEHLCVPHFASEHAKAKYLLARAAIIRSLERHLTEQKSTISILHFASIHDHKFLEYLSDVSMVLCHDGSSTIALTDVKHTDDTESSDGESDTSSSDEDDGKILQRPLGSQRLAFRRMIFWLSQHGYNTALINELQFADTKIMTTVVETTPMKPSPSLHESFEHVNGKSLSAIASMDGDHELLTQSDSEFSEREIVTLIVLDDMLSAGSEIVSAEQLSAFILHTACLSLLPLSSRRFPDSQLEDASNDLAVAFARLALARLSQASFQKALSEMDLTCDLSDLIDGRLLQVLSKSKSDQLTALKNVQVHAKYDALVDALPSISERIADYSIPPQDSNVSLTNGHSTTNIANPVLPFSNPIFDKNLGPIDLKTDETNPISPTTARIFNELSHWHNHTKPIIHKGLAPKLDPKEDWYARRRNQYFMAEMIAYAASLTNAVGKVLDAGTIIVKSEKTAKSELVLRTKKIEKAQEPAQTNALKPSKKAGAANKKGGKAAALQAAAEIQASKAGSKADTLSASWTKICKELERESNLEEQYSKAQKYINNLSALDAAVIGPEIELFKIKILLRKWTDMCKNGKRLDGLPIVALIWDTILRIQKLPGRTKSVVSKIDNIIKSLKLPNVTVDITPGPSADRPLAFSLPVLQVSKRTGPSSAEDDISIPIPSKRFQLEYCGPYFDRSIDSAPDARVSFYPDGWQRDILDAIDKNNSLFVVAPTSAGKTFISFYAMKKILEKNDDDVIVYVAPTKALVNQIAAEIQGRFSKTFKQAGRSVWGIHTRDTRINNPTGCQVLVTVPHILQIMLLAPSHVEKKSSWSYRIKRIIFDEVHCIGQAEDGLIWEQLLLLAPCPIIALSATVGNPEEFSQWLGSTQKAIGVKLDTVQHHTRYSDLRKFIFTPPDRFCFNGLPDRPKISTPGLDGSPGFAFVHPVASLRNHSRGIPTDLTFEARDCLLLYNSMKKHQTEDYPVDQTLDPEKNLPEILRKSDILQWEKELKRVLAIWISNSNSPFEDVQKDLSVSIDSHVKTGDLLSNPDRSGSDPTYRSVNPDSLESTTLPLLVELHRKDNLPAILFNFDRNVCEELAQELIRELETCEERWKESNPKWKKKMAEFEKWKEFQEKNSKKTQAVKGGKKKKETNEDGSESKADRLRDDASSESSSLASFDPKAPVEGFHFADIRKLPTSELEDLQKQLRRRQVTPWLIEALSRGVGCHHQGMNRKYRQVVEILFRKGFLRVIIATQTLALGINMPCKTVVFCGDSVSLTPLDFRQCSGRAGRRGFDLLGNVVFQNIRPSKVYRLLSSKLPDLGGSFPYRTSLVLRLCALMHGSKNSEFASRAIASLLSQPRLHLGGEESKATVLHHLRFSIEYLRREFLLSADGTPLHFAECVSHLYYTENASYAFHALLKDGYFHKLSADIDKNPERVSQTLMLVMAHLFCREPSKQSTQESIKEVTKRSPSVVFLPQLPKEAEVILRKHNHDTLDVFRNYVQTFIDQHIEEPDMCLPITKMKFRGEKGLQLAASMEATQIRSPFVALSGYGDEFDTIPNLCRTIRTGVFLEEAVLPHLQLQNDMEVPLNAYLYDFYMHGDTNALYKANGIQKGEVWFKLNDFSMVLATVATTIENFTKASPSGDADMIDVMGGGDAFEEQRGDEEPDHDIGISTPAADGESVPVFNADDGEGLLLVLKAFKLLAKEFNTKFKATWS